jgi:ligand-binding SRPBCC domain-containing protein
LGTNNASKRETPERGRIEFTRVGRGDFQLFCEQLVPQRRDQVFEFFSDAFQLEALTPPWLNFEVLTPRPIPMAGGRLIDYRLRLHGIPMRWQSRIDVWEPPVRFVDMQTRGPYKKWRHEHVFEEVNGGTMCRDIVRYSVPGGWLVERFLVRPDLLKIFTYRRDRLPQLLTEFVLRNSGGGNSVN